MLGCDKVVINATSRFTCVPQTHVCGGWGNGGAMLRGRGGARRAPSLLTASRSSVMLLSITLMATCV